MSVAAALLDLLETRDRLLWGRSKSPPSKSAVLDYEERLAERVVWLDGAVDARMREIVTAMTGAVP